MRRRRKSLMMRRKYALLIVRWPCVEARAAECNGWVDADAIAQTRQTRNLEQQTALTCINIDKSGNLITFDGLLPLAAHKPTYNALAPTDTTTRLCTNSITFAIHTRAQAYRHDITYTCTFKRSVPVSSPVRVWKYFYLRWGGGGPEMELFPSLMGLGWCGDGNISISAWSGMGAEVEISPSPIWRGGWGGGDGNISISTGAGVAT